MIRTILMALGLVALPVAVLPHSAGEWMYDQICCTATTPGASTGDCAPIPTSAVEPIRGGFVVTLRPGDHPDVTTEHRWTVTFDEAIHPNSTETKVRYSGDESYHACLYPNETVLRCLYIVPGGV
jgi:hypothetical protein